MDLPEISFSHPHDLFKLQHAGVIPNNCFVIMPFDKQFTIVWDTIKDALKGVMNCQRSDDLTLGKPVLEHILNGIKSAELIIADLTGKNPNVFYELGFAHVHTKSVLLLVRDIKDVPFDLKYLYCHTYCVTSKDDLARLRATVRKAAEDVRKRTIPEMLKGAISRTEQIVDYMKRELESPSKIKDLVIRTQAGFSSIANVRKPNSAQPDAKYQSLLDEERDCLMELIEKGAILRAIVCPPIGPWRKNSWWWTKYSKLLEFLKADSSSHQRCEFVLSPEEGNNLLFFGEKVLFEGHKTGFERGYGWTMVYTYPAFLKKRLTIYDNLFQAARAHTITNCRGNKTASEHYRLRQSVIRAVKQIRDGKCPRWKHNY